jgi:hypothetical protein
MDAETAQPHWDGAMEHLGSTQKQPDPVRVLAKVFDSNLSAYDAKFVVLAEGRGVPLVTSAQHVIKTFPKLAISPEDFVTVA